MNFRPELFFIRQFYKEMGIKIGFGDVYTNCVRVNKKTHRVGVNDSGKSCGGYPDKNLARIAGVFKNKQKIKNKINRALDEYMDKSHIYLICQIAKALNKLKERSIPPARIIIPINWLQLLLWFSTQPIQERLTLFGLTIYETDQQTRRQGKKIVPMVCSEDHFKGYEKIIL